MIPPYAREGAPPRRKRLERTGPFWRLKLMPVKRATFRTKIALAEQRVARAERVISDLERLRRLLVERGYNPLAVSDLLAGLRAAQRDYERERDRSNYMLTNGSQ